MEHVNAWVVVAEFKDAALRLTLDDGVGVFRRRQARASGVVMEEIGVQVKGIDQVEFQGVHQVDAYLFIQPDLDRVQLVMERNAVDVIEIVDVVEVHIEAGHYHYEFVIDGRASFFGIDDEGAIQPLGNMPRQRE